jgi:hypothetical protein
MTHENELEADIFMIFVIEILDILNNDLSAAKFSVKWMINW